MTGCQAELCASNVALPEHVRAGRTCSGKATLRTGRLAGWDTQHTSMSPPLLWRLGSCSASHTAVMVQAPARGLSAGLLLTHDAWHPHWTTLGPTPVKKDQEFARHGSAMVRLARGNAIGPSAERKPRIFHTVIYTLISTTLYCVLCTVACTTRNWLGLGMSGTPLGNWANTYAVYACT